MSKNITNLIFNEVTRINRNSINNYKKALKESGELIDDFEDEEFDNNVPYDNTTEKFCPRCSGLYTDYPAVSRYDNETYICPACGVEEAMINLTHGNLFNPRQFKKEDTTIDNNDINEEVNIETPTSDDLERDDENIEASKKKEIEDRIGELRKALEDEGVADDERQSMEDEIKELESMLEAVNICLEEGKKIPIHNEVSNEEIIQMFRQMVKDNPNNEKAKNFLKKYDPEYKEEKDIKKESVSYTMDSALSKTAANKLAKLARNNGLDASVEEDGVITHGTYAGDVQYKVVIKNAKKKIYANELKESVLTEAPEDEEFELVDEPTGEELPEETPIEEPIEDEEMTTDEVQDEAEEDAEETIEDDIEQPFYATTPEYDELRDLLIDLDYRLFLINDNMVCIGRLNGPDIEFLTSNRPENTETEPSEQNDKAEEIENKAEEDGEQSFEYKWIKAPDTFDKFVNQVNVVYLSPEMSDEDKEQYAGIEASHESVMDFLMNELPEDKKEEHENEEIEDEIPEEVPPIEEPTEDDFSEEIEEPTDEEIPEDEEEEEE